ncbi:MAG: hypothetical protein JNL74_04975, partial [Fibrobacteres bacterium]|nr:hypothetical protein [Fibrobacterota bacterium]
MFRRLLKVFPGFMIFVLAAVSSMLYAANISVSAVDYQQTARENGPIQHKIDTLVLRAALDESETGLIAVHADSNVNKLRLSLLPFVNKRTKRTLQRSSFKLNLMEFVSIDS